MICEFLKSSRTFPREHASIRKHSLALMLCPHRNACKFTPTGGSVTFKTRLLHPTSNSNEKSNAIIIPVTDEKHPLKEIPLDSPTSEDAMPFDRTLRQDVAIIRMEITDSGVGIRPRDLVDNRLFSPYVQTAIGRTQGGKGSGKAKHSQVVSWLMRDFVEQGLALLWSERSSS